MEVTSSKATRLLSATLLKVKLQWRFPKRFFDYFQNTESVARLLTGVPEDTVVSESGKPTFQTGNLIEMKS